MYKYEKSISFLSRPDAQHSFQWEHSHTHTCTHSPHVWCRTCSSASWCERAGSRATCTFAAASGTFMLMRPCTAWFIYSKIHVAAGESSVSLEITWRGPKTETSQHSLLFFPLLVHGRRVKDRRTKAKSEGAREGEVEEEEEEDEWEGWGVLKKSVNSCSFVTCWNHLVSIQGQRGQRREGNLFFLRSAGNSSCLTNSLDPRWANLYALSSPLVSDSESVSKPIIMFVSDIIDLCGRACLRACAWKGNLQAGFFSHAPSSQRHRTHTAEQSVSGKQSVSVRRALRRMSLQRSNYAGFESTDTPMSKTDSINHTQSLVGENMLFSILLRVRPGNTKPRQIQAVKYLLSPV